VSTRKMNAKGTVKARKTCLREFSQPLAALDVAARILNCVVDAGRDRELVGGGERLVDAIMVARKLILDAAQAFEEFRAPGGDS